MKFYTNYNANPQGLRIGDCVLRAFTSFLQGPTYEEVKEGILKYGYDYTRAKNFEPYAFENDLVKIDLLSSQHKGLGTFNQLALFCEQYNVRAIGMSMTHLVYVDPKIGVVDTWDSRMRRTVCFFIEKKDADRIGIPYTTQENKTIMKIAEKKIMKKGSKFLIVDNK